MTPFRVLVAVIAIFVVVSALVLVWIPPWEANDEPDHVENAVTLARGDWYRMEPDTGTEAHQAPAYYIALSAWHRAVGLEPKDPAPPGKGFAVLIERGALFRHDYAGHDDDERQVRLLRLPSVACGVATILLTLACARRLTRDPWTPVAAAATVAFIPRFVFLSGAVNNDNLVNALGALVAFLLVRWVTEPPATPRARLLATGGVGLVYGALVLTKVSTIPLVLGVVLALGFLGRCWGERSLLMGAAAVATGLVCGWWLMRNQIWYGDPLAAEATNEHFRPRGLIVGGEPRGLITRTFSSIPRMVYRSFFYTSGWNQFVWPFSYYVPFWLLTGGALAGLAPLRRAPSLSVEVRRAVGVLGVLLLAAFGSVWITDLSNSALPGTIQARLAFSALAPFGCLMAIGLERLPLPVIARFALPVLGLAGTLFALHTDVWQVYVS